VKGKKVKNAFLMMAGKENAADSCRVFRATKPRWFGFKCDNVQGDLVDNSTIFGLDECAKWVGHKGITSTSTVGEVTRYGHPLQQDRSMSVRIDDVDTTTVIFGADRGNGGRNFLFKATLFCGGASQL